jgi:hypothetical protein
VSSTTNHQSHEQQQQPQQQQQQQQPASDADHATLPPSSTAQSSTLSAVARRRLMRAHPGQQQQQAAQESSSKETSHRQPQHLQGGPIRTYAYREQQQQQQPLSLDLHCTESVDSDDNGTCFNSIGTTTPRQPPYNASPHKLRDDHGHHNHSMQLPHLHRDLQTLDTDLNDSSQKSRYYDRHGKLSPLAEMSPSPRNNEYSSSIISNFSSETSNRA